MGLGVIDSLVYLACGLTSPHAARAAERRNGERSHHYGKGCGEADSPELGEPMRAGRKQPPIAPGGKRSARGEKQKGGAGNFVEELPRDAPQRIKKRPEGAPECDEYAHERIVVQQW